MLFSYKFFTLSQSFSQLPNKFYIRKSTITHTPASIENPPPPTPPQQQQKKSEIKERKIKRLREREIDLQWRQQD